MKDLYRLLFVLFLAHFSLLSVGQNPKFKDQRFTYLWDVTLSMKGYNGSPDIYDRVMESMIKDINKLSNERTEIIVIPFQDRAYCEIWKSNATNEGKEKLIHLIRDYKNDQVTSTNLALPLEYAIQHIFTSDKMDILKMMTDGKTSDSTKKQLTDIIARWCTIALEKDVYGYFILLTDEAKDEEVITSLNDACRFDVLNTPNIGDIKGIEFPKQIACNIRDDFDKEIILQMNVMVGERSIPDGYRLHIYAVGNDYVEMDEVVEVKNNRIKFTPRFKKSKEQLISDLPIQNNENIVFKLEAADTDQYPMIRLMNDECKLELINKPEKTLRIYVQ